MKIITGIVFLTFFSALQNVFAIEDQSEPPSCTEAVTIAGFISIQTEDRTRTWGIAPPRSEPGEELLPWYEEPKDPMIQLMEHGMQGSCIFCHTHGYEIGFVNDR